MYYKALTARMTTAELKIVYNEFSDKPVKHFQNRIVGIRRTASLMEDKNLIQKDFYGLLSDKTLEAIRTAPKVCVDKLPGPKSKFDDALIYKLNKDNPRKKDTLGYYSYNLITNGMTGSEFRSIGGRYLDLKWDIQHKNAEIRT